MKREIKFRAWHSGNKIMSYEFELGDDWIVFPGGEFGAHPLSEECEVMQFTGLHDKNGREIYEGDILKSEYILSYFGIEWDNDYCCYNWYIMTPTTQTSASLTKTIDDAVFKTGKNFCDIIEVVGNIFENTALIYEHH